MFEQYNGLVAALTAQLPPPDPSVSTKDGSVDGIKYRVYTPEAGQKSSLSMGIYTHGGGLIAGDLDSEDRLCRAISQKVPCILVSVDYRLGPKYKLPTMLQDSLKVAEWVSAI
jgi:versiconal hemiacetal acetate esterase